MRLGLKNSAIIFLCFFLALAAVLLIKPSKKKICSEINDDFKTCLDQQLIEHDLKGKEDCNINVYFKLIDFCKKAVVEYP